MSHEEQHIDRRDHILDNILQAVGETPLVRLNRVPQNHGLQCEVLAKCEYLNPGGSVKDRIGVRMLKDAIASGRVKKDDILIEPTSGNTGVGLSMSAAVLGYKMVITLPLKMSHEKVSVLKALGAEVIRTPNVAFDHPDSLISLAHKMQKEDSEHRHVLDQYSNSSNWMAHYDGTGEEIFRQTGGKVDMVVLTTGTGGTMTGVAKKLKEKIPGVKVVGVDPIGSLLANPPAGVPPNSSYQVEGIGYDFVPEVCHRQYVDEWIKTDDQSSFDLAREIHKSEGMLIGGSSGSAMAGVLQAAKSLKAGQRCVVVFPDNIRNYLTKFVDDNWMIEKGLLQGEVQRPTYDSLQAERDALAKKVAELEAKLAEKK